MSVTPYSPNVSLTQRIKAHLRYLYGYRYLLEMQIREDLQRRYFQTKLGPIWLFLQPLLMAIVFTIAFTVFARIGSGDVPYPVFFLGGYLPWTYIQSATADTSTVIVNNARLIGSYRFPAELLVIAMVLSELVDFLFGIMVWLMLIFLVFQEPFYWTILYLPLLFVLQFILGLGLSFWSATLNVRTRDYHPFLHPLQRAVFHFSPIFYPIALIPETILPYYMLNPIAGLVTAYRDAMFDGQLHYGGAVMWAFGISIIILITGYIYFKRSEPYFPDVV
jgi:ABC-type polysaccharide/polyol phosphate export permease